VVSLKEVRARQTSKGVSAAPLAKRRVFPHTFIAQSMGGHVFERKGKSRFPIHKLWGRRSQSSSSRRKSKLAFETTVHAELPARLEHEISALLGGRAPEG
jgi:hypothetical protein